MIHYILKSVPIILDFVANEISFSYVEKENNKRSIFCLFTIQEIAIANASNSCNFIDLFEFQNESPFY